VAAEGVDCFDIERLAPFVRYGLVQVPQLHCVVLGRGQDGRLPGQELYGPDSVEVAPQRVFRAPRATERVFVHRYLRNERRGLGWGG